MDKFVRFDNEEAAKKLEELAKQDLRSEGNTVAVLILQEYARRFSQPSIFTIAEAEAAGEEGG